MSLQLAITFTHLHTKPHKIKRKLFAQIQLLIFRMHSNHHLQT